MLKFTGTIEVDEASYTNKDLNLNIQQINKLNNIIIDVEMVKQYTIQVDNYVAEQTTTTQTSFVTNIVDGEEVVTEVTNDVVTTQLVNNPVTVQQIGVIKILKTYTLSPDDYTFTQIQDIVKSNLETDFPNVTFSVI